jgi:hypothetical protein
VLDRPETFKGYVFQGAIDSNFCVSKIQLKIALNPAVQQDLESMCFSLIGNAGLELHWLDVNSIAKRFKTGFRLCIEISGSQPVELSRK